jgi:sulfotransferase family protein
MSESRGPIFIGGVAKSGKTPLRIVLGAHPNLSMTRQTYMWPRFYGRFGDLSRSRNLEHCLSAMFGKVDVHRLEPDPERIRREFREGPPTYAHLFALFHRHQAERNGKRRWGEQLTSAERFADPIFAAFPTARMIHMIRDPRTRYAARKATNHTLGKVGWETAMWLYSIALAERNRRQYPENYKVVRYEALAARPVETVLEVCAFIDEEFVPSMERALATISFGGKDGSGPPRALAHTKSGSPADVAFVNLYARRELRALDYPPMNPRLSPRDHLSFLLVDRPLNLATMTAWRVLKRGTPAKRVGKW